MFRRKCLRPGVLRRKRDMIVRMEVLSGDLEGEAGVGEELVDVVDDAAAVFDCECSVRFAEVFLHVDDDEGGFLGGGHDGGSVAVRLQVMLLIVGDLLELQEWHMKLCCSGETTAMAHVSSVAVSLQSSGMY